MGIRGWKARASAVAHLAKLASAKTFVYHVVQYPGGRGAEVLEVIKTIVASIAVAVEFAGALIVAYGAGEAVHGSGKAILAGRMLRGERKEVWLRFAVWLLLGLEFQLAADVIRTAVSPTWSEIGQLAAIAGIRTFLNFFLERDLEAYDARGRIAPRRDSRIAA